MHRVDRKVGKKIASKFQWRLYEIDEAMMLAECEFKYFQDLIMFLERTGYYHLFEDCFLELKLFRNDFVDKMGELEHLLEVNRKKFSNNRHMKLLKDIYSRCQELRDRFDDIHINFVKKIDGMIEKAIARRTARKMKASIALAENCASNLMTNKEDKEILESLIGYLKINIDPLRKKSKDIGKTINGMSVKDIHEDFDRDLDSEEYNAFMQQVVHFYSVQLAYFHQRITSKLNFVFSEKKPNETCGEILKIRDKANSTRYYSSCRMWYKVENKSCKNNDIDLIVNFIKSNLSFFIAPFTHRVFQYWAKDHFEEMREISDGLRKYLKNEKLENEFHDALESLKEEKDDGLLRYFLRSMEDTGFLEFLEECIKDPYYIIDEWNHYAAFNLR